MKVLTNHNNLITRKAKQSGFSLIELLIASTLGLFVMGGVITTFMGTKDSEQMRSAISEMDANARTAIEILRKSISIAGYSSMRTIPGFDKPFYSESDGEKTDETCKTGVKMHTSGAIPGDDQYTKDSGGTTHTNGRGDVLTVVLLADNPCMPGSASCTALANVNPKAMVYTDCAGGSKRDAQAVSCSTDRDVGLGQDDPLEAKLYSTFFLGGGNADEKRILKCRGNRGGTTPLVDNVEYLQFLYGVTRLDGTTEYLNATDVEAGADLWSRVTSVRVGLLMRSSNKNLLKVASTKDKYILLDRNVKVEDMHRLYRTYTTTISLPNRKKGQALK